MSAKWWVIAKIQKSDFRPADFYCAWIVSCQLQIVSNHKMVISVYDQCKMFHLVINIFHIYIIFWIKDDNEYTEVIELWEWKMVMGLRYYYASFGNMCNVCHNKWLCSHKIIWMWSKQSNNCTKREWEQQKLAMQVIYYQYPVLGNFMCWTD